MHFLSPFYYCNKIKEKSHVWRFPFGGDFYNRGYSPQVLLRTDPVAVSASFLTEIEQVEAYGAFGAVCAIGCNS